MTWTEFNYLAPPVVVFWLTAAGLALKNKKRAADLCMLIGIALMGVFIAGLWLKLERPPMRTMGETRLWYAFFLSALGFAAYKRWQYSWLLGCAVVTASVFVIINLVKPEIHSIALMPALQSYYFVPHVTVYILAYSILGVGAIASLAQFRRLSCGMAADRKLYDFIDNVVYIGLGFLLLGLLSGAAWAKEAWGHYWSWDPKETWAFVTAAAYLLYIHLRLRDIKPRLTLMTLPVAFILLMITWLGVSYLPAAQGSIHVYAD